MVRIYRRHLKSCPHTSERERRCKCPIHVEGTIGIERIKPHSLNLTSWEAATKKVREWESSGTIKGIEQKKLKDAIRRYEENVKSRKLSDSTQKKIQKLLSSLFAFTGDVALHQVDIDTLRIFQESWQTWGALVQQKQIERLRTFFRFCLKAKWISENPAAHLDMPEPIPSDKPPVFTSEELHRIHATIKRPIMRAFVLTLEHTGLRISDAVQLQKQLIKDGRLSIITKKKKVRVELPLPPVLLAALEAIPTTQYYFWTGESKLSTVIGSKRRGLAKLLKRAAVSGNPHKFRHTLASNMIANGTSPAMVAKVLGNSEQIVRRVYAHWLPEMQRQLEVELKKTWEKPKLFAVK